MQISIVENFKFWYIKALDGNKEKAKLTYCSLFFYGYNDGFQYTLALIVYYDVDYYIIVFVRDITGCSRYS